MTYSCPIPQVEETLSPYIRARQEALQIRQIINRDLQQKHGGSALVSHLNSLSLDAESSKPFASTGSDGIRQRYLEALQAHKRAQTTFSTVKADLELMRKSFSPRVDSNIADVDSIKGYAQSVRSKKQRDKLEAVQRALTRLDELEPHPVKIDIKSTVRSRLGEPPEAPQMSTSDHDVDARIEELTVGLKKSIIQAKADLDTAKEDRELARRRVEEYGDIRPDLILSAFQAARQELIQWIESELTKVTDEEEQSQHDEGHLNDAEYTQQEVQSQVTNLYERYVASRRILLQNVETISDVTQTQLPELNVATQSSPSRARDNSKESLLTASQLLSFLPLLMQLSRDEAAVLQQTAFVRKQFNQGANETKQTIQRLAGESHLAAPDATSTHAWDTATRELSEQTRSSVLENVKAGSESIKHAQEVLAALQAKRSALEHLKGNT